MWRRIRPFLLLTLVGSGALGGLLTTQLLRQHEARFALPVDLITFRASEANLSNLVEFRKFGAATGNAQTTEFQRLEAAIAYNGALVSAHHRYEGVARFKKRDWRDMPDAVVTQIVGNAVIGKEGVSVRADAVVSGFDADPEVARKTALLAMDFLRHEYYMVGLRQQFHGWGPTSKVELARAAETIAWAHASLASNERKLASILVIREKYRDLREISAPVASGVQVQVQGAKNLSPVQQAIGLETDRMELEETLKTSRCSIAYYQLLVGLVDEFAPRIDGNTTPVAIASQMREWLASRKVGDDAVAREALERAQATVELGLTGLSAQWLDTKPDPVAPLVTATGPKRLLGLVGGVVLGFLLWLAVLLHRPALAGLERVLAETAPQRSPTAARGS